MTVPSDSQNSQSFELRPDTIAPKSRHANTRQLREIWNGVPVKCGDLFGLQKTRGPHTHQAVCALFTHQFGWEVRLLIGEDMQRTQVCSSIPEFMDTADAWKAALVDKGWS